MAAKLDRSSPGEAEAILRRLIPQDAHYAAAIGALAELASVAAAIDPESWSITVYPALVRLNVGRILVCDVTIGNMVLVGPSDPEISPSTRAAVQKTEEFRVMPGVLRFRFAHGEASFLTVLAELMPVSRAVVAEAAARSRAPWRRAHSPGIVQLLERLLDRPLPTSYQPAAVGQPPKTVPRVLAFAARLEAVSVNHILKGLPLAKIPPAEPFYVCDPATQTLWAEASVISGDQARVLRPLNISLDKNVRQLHVDLIDLQIHPPSPCRLEEREARAINDLTLGRPPPTLVKVAAAQGGAHWEDCLQNGYICVGWDEMGDLRRFTDFDTFYVAFSQIYAGFYKHNKSKITLKSRELWTFHSLVPGDRVIANLGTSKILAVGEVLAEAYVFEPDRDNYQQTVHVHWDTSVARRIMKQGYWAMTTIDAVTPEFYRAVVTRAPELDPEEPAPASALPLPEHPAQPHSEHLDFLFVYTAAQDHKFAAALETRLVELGHERVDIHRSKRSPAEELSAEALLGVDMVLVLISKHSDIEARTSLRDVRIAGTEARLLLLPIVLDDVPVPLEFNDFSPVIASRGDISTIVSEVQHRIRFFQRWRRQPEQTSSTRSESVDDDPVEESPVRVEPEEHGFAMPSPPPSPAPVRRPTLLRVAQSDKHTEDDDSRLRFPGEWRFDATLTREVPPGLRQDLYSLIETIAKSAKNEWHIVGLFQDRFGGDGSSSLSFAYGDLDSAMRGHTTNGALFVEYFWRGVHDAKRVGADVPTVANLNVLFRKHQFPYELAPPDLRRTDTSTTPTRGQDLSAAPPRSNPAPRDHTSASAAPVSAAPSGDTSDLDRLIDLAAPASATPSAANAADADDLLALHAPAGAAPSAMVSSLPPSSSPLRVATPAPVPLSAEPPRPAPWDPRTVTLTITATGVRLGRGRQLGVDAAPIWSRDVSLDWSQAHFVDESDRLITLDQVLDRLPLQWERPLVEAFGQQLARLLFGDPIPSEIHDELILPSGETRRLILVLDPEHQRVPWEFLRIDAHFLAEQQLSIVRHVQTTSDPMPLVVDRPRIVLFAYANPGGDDAAKYDGDAHKQKILDALDTFQATVRPAELCSAAGLEKLLCTGDGQIFHFLGHGVAGGTWDDASLVLHGEHDGGRCSAEQIGLWMRDRRRSLAVLGACYGAAVPRAGLLSSVGGRIVHTSGTPVVAMQMEVPQTFSTAFVERFYRELPGAGFNVEVAVFLGRRARCDERHAFGIPVLLADARGLDQIADLRCPPGEAANWARFVAVASLPPLDAVAAWSDMPADIARAAAEAIQKNAERDPSARYPRPPDDPSQLPGRIADLRHAIRDPDARICLAAASAVAPAPKTLALTGGVIEPLDELPLSHRLTVERCRAAIDRVHADFSLPAGLVARIVGELRAGKHVMLTGPVGTGKTSIAQAVVRALGYDVHLDTASADWTRFEILGGFMPTPREGSGELQFTFRPGVFLEAVCANWSAEPKIGSPHVTLWRRVRHPGGGEGMWLILDELNRADMDRALGGIFTALETRRLRVPASGPDGGTVEIPIPEDFRVIATMNAADRHFLFRLSDALKRRFAFVHVPVTVDWSDEWTRLCRETRLPPSANTDDLRRFVALVRMFHPLGSALFLAALRLYATSDFVTELDPEWPLTQSIEGALLPNLEDLTHASLVALHTWSEGAAPDRLAQSLLAALPQSPGVEPERLTALAALAPELSPQFQDDDDPLALATPELIAAWVARRVARPPEAAPLPRLGRALMDLIRHAPHA